MTDLEKQILGQVQVSIAKAIDSELVGYNKPLNKLAEMLVGQMSGHVEKAVNRVRQDPTLKAKMILAIEDIIESEGK